MDRNKSMAEAYVRVEFDLDYSGGNYAGVGQQVYVPIRLVEDCLGNVEQAFAEYTGFKAQHVIHYNLDELFDAQGNCWEESLEEQPFQVVLASELYGAESFEYGSLADAKAGLLRLVDSACRHSLQDGVARTVAFCTNSGVEG